MNKKQIIECIVKSPYDDLWYMLDECGRYETIPEDFKVEVIP